MRCPEPMKNKFVAYFVSFTLFTSHMFLDFPDVFSLLVSWILYLILPKFFELISRKP